MVVIDNKKDQMAFDFMENAYLVIPRSVLERALSPEKQERQAGMLHLALLAKCYHSDGTVLLSGGKVPCRRSVNAGLNTYCSNTDCSIRTQQAIFR